MVKQILAFDTKDDPGFDGTTAFSIAFAKNYKDIVKIFLDRQIGQSSDFKGSAKKATESRPNKHAVGSKSQ
jgi:hypothetical protein